MYKWKRRAEEQSVFMALCFLTMALLWPIPSSSEHLDSPTMMHCTLDLWARINPFCYVIFVGAFYYSNRKRNKSLAGGTFLSSMVSELERLPLKTISLYSNLCQRHLKKMCFQCSVNKNSWKQAVSAESDGLIRMPHYGKVGMLTPSLPPTKGPKSYLILG